MNDLTPPPQPPTERELLAHISASLARIEARVDSATRWMRIRAFFGMVLSIASIVLTLYVAWRVYDFVQTSPLIQSVQKIQEDLEKLRNPSFPTIRLPSFPG